MTQKFFAKDRKTEIKIKFFHFILLAYDKQTLKHTRGHHDVGDRIVALVTITVSPTSM